MQQTPNEEIFEGLLRESQNFSKAKGKVSNLQVVLKKPSIDKVHHLSKTEHEPKKGDTVTRVLFILLCKTNGVPVLHGNYTPQTSGKVYHNSRWCKFTL